MESAGNDNDRPRGNGWEVRSPSLHSSLAYGQQGTIGGGLSSSSGGAPPPGFNPSNNSGEESRHFPPSEPQIWKDSSSANMQNDRSSSFNNLAEVFGNGLAESINDAVLTDTFLSSDKKEDNLNYARQSRHTASRMVRNNSDHKAPETGSLFTPVDAHNHNNNNNHNHSRDRSLPKYSSNGMGGGRGRDDYSRDHRDRSVGGLYSSMDGYGTAFVKDCNSQGVVGPGGVYNNTNNIRDLGTTVTEPSESRGRRGDDGTADLQRQMKNLWSSDDQPPKSASPKDPREIQMQAEDDLRPFTWDTRHHDPSRALVIQRALALSAAEVRMACESYGVVDTFRSDFADRGIFFVSYYDIRCAQYAAMELVQNLLQVRNGDKVLVQFCVPLNSSSQFDESLVVLNDIPMDRNVDSLMSVVSYYGAVRTLRSLGGNYGGTSFVAEFHDVKDAKQAVLELESSQPWGPNVSVEIAARNPSERKRGRELLSLISRWRQGESSPSDNRRHPSSGGGGRHPPYDQPRTNYVPSPHAGNRPDFRYNNDRGGGPDRGYGQSYVVVNDSSYNQSYGNMPPSYHGDHHSNHHGGYHHGHHGGPPSHHYWSGPPPQQHHYSGGSSVVSASSAYSDGHHSGHYPTSSRSVPYYPDAGSIGSHSHNIRSVPEGGTPGRDEKDNRHLKLDVEAVENGRDSRTSLMVRNIPNKYTQQMLLSEFAENGHGPGTIDFFYLPIDFKNKCNRGYAFINFVEYRDILPFHRRYYGKHWRTFNSDKICEITYARIQGKSAMLKRFENSALMEKDDEYKPLVFVSNGADRGKPLPFPDPSNRS